MKSSYLIKLLLVMMTLVCLVAALSLLTSCRFWERETSAAETTTAAPDAPFEIVGNADVRVEKGEDQDSFILYVDAEKKTIDLKTLVRGYKEFSVQTVDGQTVPNGVITPKADGEQFIIYYDFYQKLARVTVVFNRYATLTFEGLSLPVRVLVGELCEAPTELPKKDGHTFLGWNMDFTKPVEADASVSAKWKANEYLITFQPNGGNMSQTTMKAVYGETITLPIPTKVGYVFTGWQDGVSVINSGIWTIDHDVTLTAMWDTHDYMITYDPNGGYVEKPLQGISYGAPFVMPIPTRSGYTFGGWFCDGKAVDASAYAYREDKTFVAKWEENRYFVTFESNGGSACESGEYLYSELSAIVPIRSGYTFGGWFFDSDLKKTDADIRESNAVTAYAYWKEETLSGDLIYELTGSGAVILGVKSEAASYRIPSYIGGLRVVAIGENAFCDQTALECVIWPSTVKTIGARAFSGCIALKEINAVINEDLTQPIVLDGITEIGAYAFSGCPFEEITLPKEITILADGVFFDCQNLRKVNIADFKVIGTDAFSGCILLETADCSSAVSIGKNAFRGCTSLVTVTLPSGLRTLENGIFADCTSLVAVTLPTSITVIGDEAFRGCLSLEAVENFLTSTRITKIGAYAFSGCELLNTVGIPTSLTLLGEYAFEDCKKLQSVLLPKAITSLANGVFKGCTYLKTLTLSSELTAIGDYTFSGCRRLTGIDLTDRLTSVGAYAFEGCMAISEINLTEALTAIGEGAFKDCSRLSKAMLSSTITVIPQKLFEGCLALTDVVWHNGITEIGAYAFSSCQALSVSEIPTSCVVIGEAAFSGCRAIASLSIREGLTKIGSRAFADCISLSEVVFFGTSERWKGAVAADAFEGCDDLRPVTIVSVLAEDLRESLWFNTVSGAYFAVDTTLAFNEMRPAMVLFFKPNNVFYRNFIDVTDDGLATMSKDYIWRLDVTGSTEILSNFSMPVTVTLFDFYDMGGYGYIRFDLGEGVRSLQPLKVVDITVNVYDAAEPGKLLYTAPLGSIDLPKETNDLTPDPERSESEIFKAVTTETAGAESLFDGNYESVYFSHSREAIVLTADAPFVLTSYSMITGKMQSAYANALPSSWTLYGGIVLKDGTVEWIEVSRIDNSWMHADNLTEYNFKVSGTKAYSTYKIEFEGKNALMLSEIKLYSNR